MSAVLAVIGIIVVAVICGAALVGLVYTRGWSRVTDVIGRGR